MARTIDFFVIGAGKAGTTSLWHGLSGHPQISTPLDKERGFFTSDDRYAKGLAHYVKKAFPHAAPGDKLGTVTPGYMSGVPERLDMIITRMAAVVPDAQLVALLRDPIERAVSHFRDGLRSRPGVETTFDEHVRRLIAARGGLPETWLIQHGCYGRILARYLETFDRDRLLVLFTDDLEQRPRELYRRLFAFLGVDESYEPPDLERRLHRGGTRTRVSQEALQELQQHLDQYVFTDRRSPATREARRAFYWWTSHIWNVEPDESHKEIGDELRRELEAFYLEDGELLLEMTGEEPPWLASYRASAARVSG